MQPTVQLTPLEGTWWATITYRRQYFDARGYTPLIAAQNLLGEINRELPFEDEDRSPMLMAVDEIIESLSDPDGLRHSSPSTSRP